MLFTDIKLPEMQYVGLLTTIVAKKNEFTKIMKRSQIMGVQCTRFVPRFFSCWSGKLGNAV